jgi:hypothetical protein
VSGADERLVHALLLTRAERDRTARVERVARALEEESPRRRLRAVLSASLAVAASLLVLVPLFFMSGSAEARALEELIDGLDRQDQTFAIEVLEGPAPPLRPRTALRELRGARRFPRPSPARLDGGRLYVRGDEYLLSRDSAGGRPALYGFDGATGWALHPRAGLREGLPARRAPLAEEISDLLVLDLRDLLSTVRAGYELRSVREADDEGLVRLRARRRAGASGPAVVQLTFDPATGQLHELVCADLRLRRGARQFALRLTFVSDEPLPEDWFAPEGHAG